MQYSDQGFEEFQNNINGIREEQPVLWRLRDSIYTSICYNTSDGHPLRRHKYGRVSWIAWCLRQALPRLEHSWTKYMFQYSAVPARYGFLFYGFHDAHYATLYPLLSEFSEVAPVIVWISALKPEQERDLDSLSNVKTIKIHDDIRRYTTNQMFSDVSCALKLQSALEKIPMLSAEQRTAIKAKRSEIASVVFDYLQWKRVWQEMDPVFPDTALFVTSEASPMTKALTDIMRNRGARVIHLAHGYLHATSQVSNATEICVLNELERQWLHNRVPSICSVVAVGNPRLEEVRKKVGPPRSRFKGEPFRFLFFNAGVEGQYKRNMQIDDLSILATSNDLKNRFTLRMRPHPRERIEDLKYTVNKAGLVVDEWGTGLLWEDLVWCDAAGTSLSTSLLEAAVCGRPCYWINARDDGIFRTDELRKSGLGLLVRSKGEWEKAVIDLFDSRIKPPARIPDDLLYKLKIIPAVSEPWRVRLKI